MYFTYVVRPGEAPEGRGPQLEPFWSFCVDYNLRIGLLIQLAAYGTLLAACASGDKDPLSLLNFFRSTPDSVGKPQGKMPEVTVPFSRTSHKHDLCSTKQINPASVHLSV